MCHHGCWCQNAKTRFSGKLSNLVSCNCAFQRTHYWISKIQDSWDPPSLKSTWCHFFLLIEGGPIWIKFRRLVQNDMSTAVMWSKSKPDVEFQYRGRLGEFNSMSSQSHVSHCRVLPLGEFTVTIPEPHATLQGAVTWRNQCHDRATFAGCNNSIHHIKNRFRRILFIFLIFFTAVWALTSGGFRIVSDTQMFRMF